MDTPRSEKPVDPHDITFEACSTQRLSRRAFGLRLIASMELSLFSPRRMYELFAALPSLAPRERWIYLRLQIRNCLSRRRPVISPFPRAVRRILFVCDGNIIRSPFAAAVFPRLLPSGLQNRISTSSAGLRTTPSKSADPRAIQLAKEFGASLDFHRTQRLTPGLVENADLILVMDTLNAARFLVRYPDAKRKLFILGTFSGVTEVSRPDIRDPYSGDLDDIRRCYQTMSQRLSSLAHALSHGSDVEAQP